MTITFRIIEPQNLPPNQENHITFDTQGGTIGRLSTDNDWVLHNEFVSGEHAKIQYREDGYYIVDHSNNGTSLHFHNEEHRLNNGNILYLGDYDIEVTIENLNSQSIQPTRSTKTTTDSISILTFRIREPQDLPPEQESHFTFDTQGGKIGRLSTPNDWVLHNDYVSEEHATIQHQEDGYYIVDHSSNGTSLHFHNEEHRLNNGDILYIGDYNIEVSIEILSPVKEPVPDTTSTPTTPRTTTAPIPRPAPQPIEQPVLSPPGDVQEAVGAFLEGAGLENIPIDQLDPDLMVTLGKAFRETLAGIIKLVEARKMFKIEIDLGATRTRYISAGLNNPLKVNQDPSMVLKIMLFKAHSYLPMLDSIQEAFEDTEAHLLAMGGGIMGSLKNTLERFSPNEIERIVEQQHKSKWFNPDSRKWKEFVERYNKLDINDLLSEELAQAYEEQIRRLDSKTTTDYFQQRGH